MKTLTNIFLLVVFSLALTGGLYESAQAATPCTWTGATSRDWMTPTNWSCGVVPTAAHDVTIANVTNDPLITGVVSRQVNTLTIEPGAVLEATEGGRLSLLVQIWPVGDGIINYGTIKTSSTRDDTSITLFVGTTFHNYGTIDIGVGTFWATAYKGGTQNGTLSGEDGTIILEGSSGTFSFGIDSLITVNTIIFEAVPTVNINGKINQTWPGSSIHVNQSFVTYSFTLPYKLGAVEVNTLYGPGWFKMVMAGSNIGSISVPLMAILNGSGSVSENLENYGTVSPGESAGMISVGGDYTQFVTSNPAVLEIELGGLEAGTSYDQLLVAEHAALDGTFRVSLLDPFTPSLGQTFTIMTYGSRTGEFDQTEYPSLPPGLGFELAYGADSLTLTVVDAPLLVFLPVIIR